MTGVEVAAGGKVLPAPTERAVRRVLSEVDDPEYPGISIVDLGLVETVSLQPDGTVTVGLIPTFSGCPALAMIADDVRQAVLDVPGVGDVAVEWLNSPAWSVERVSQAARAIMADEFTVAVRIGAGPALCPRCATPTVETSMFGPSRCRAVHRCPTCTESIEVMRS